jgi:hypothetical protein
MGNLGITCVKLRLTLWIAWGYPVDERCAGDRIFIIGGVINTHPQKLSPEKGRLLTGKFRYFGSTARTLLISRLPSSSSKLKNKKDINIRGNPQNGSANTIS